GPWLVPAYPVAVAPAHVSVDNAGCLQCDQLIADRWAHAYRYFIQPYSRYQRLWEAVGDSALPEPPSVEEDNIAGAAGADVVLSRTQPLSAPVVLRSSRLDVPDERDVPRPGPIWEVVVAQHTEQTLSEHNQSLARRLSYRGIAFTMVRRFQ